MMAYRKMNAASFCKQAVAYLKPALSDKEAPVTIDISDADAPVLTNLENGLLALYIVDEDDHFEFVQGRVLKAAGLSVDQLDAIGRANLARKASRGIRLVPHGSIYAVLLDGNFEASLILLDELWDDALAKYVEHSFTVAIPARDVLAFCDSESRVGLDELREVVARVTPGGDHLVSERLYRRESKHWIPFADA